MKTFMRILPILLFLLVTSPLFSGCSFLGYAGGSALDSAIADNEIDTDLSSLEKGDYLRLEWKDGHTYLGQVLSVEGPDNIKISYTTSEYRVETYLSDLVHDGKLANVERIDAGKMWRITGATIGAVFDLASLYLIIFFPGTEGWGL